MTGFPLPATPAVNLPAFRDAESASLWLARQPQANLPAMLSGLLDQLEAFNRHDLSPRERFKTLEVLRKAVFAVGDGCRRRCEGKPLPLAAAEQATLDSARRLWRNYAAGYQRCLQACLDGDSSLSRRSARVAHRMAFCLRMEQLTGYAGSAAPGPGFWKSFHALFLATERLGCAGEAVEDRLLGETRASSVSGQYAMALMLHLAQPFSLSGGQLAAAVRWLARWRERVRIASRPDAEAKSPPLLLDLSADTPLHDGEGEAHLPRWLVLDAVLGKIRGRCAALAAGESPESLKLGDRLSAESCMALLETLAGRLQRLAVAAAALKLQAKFCRPANEREPPVAFLNQVAGHAGHAAALVHLHARVARAAQAGAQPAEGQILRFEEFDAPVLPADAVEHLWIGGQTNDLLRVNLVDFLWYVGLRY